MSKTYKNNCFFNVFGGRGPRNRSQVGHVGAFFGHLGSKLGVLGPTWLQVGGLGASLAPSRGSWDRLGSKLGPSWAQVGPKLGQVGPKLGPSWASWCQVGGKLGQVGAMWIFQDFWREPGREGTPHFRNNYAFWALVHTKQQLAVEYKQQLRNCRI